MVKQLPKDTQLIGKGVGAKTQVGLCLLVRYSFPATSSIAKRWKTFNILDTFESKAYF